MTDFSYLRHFSMATHLYRVVVISAPSVVTFTGDARDGDRDGAVLLLTVVR